VGLWVSPDRLVQVRRSRLSSMGETATAIMWIWTRSGPRSPSTRQLFERQEWPTIDVSRRSIEETAASVMNLLAERREAVG
jgi:regulator of PEP synthase PpsR (kinase-PPPase family)